MRRREYRFEGRVRMDTGVVPGFWKGFMSFMSYSERARMSAPAAVGGG